MLRQVHRVPEAHDPWCPGQQAYHLTEHIHVDVLKVPIALTVWLSQLHTSIPGTLSGCLGSSDGAPGRNVQILKILFFKHSQNMSTEEKAKVLRNVGCNTTAMLLKLPIPRIP